MTPAARSFVIVVCAVMVAAGIGVIGLGFIVNTNDKSEDIKDLSEQVVRIGERIEDCSATGGKCYQENQKRTGAAIQTLLEASKAQLDPHRLRNEAENLCNVVAMVEVTLNVQGRVPIDIKVVLDHYRNCVLENSGGTEPPPVPPNPYVTTTTTRKGQP